MLQTPLNSDQGTSIKHGRSRFWIILFLGIINALTPFTIDLYLPAFADIANDLGSTVQRVSLSVATYFVGFAIGQILYGPLLDRFGRKPPIFFGLGIYILASIGCMQAKSVETLLIFRFVAALGGSASSVGALAMVRDYFSPDEGARIFSMLMLVLSASPLFAPSIGSWISVTFGWRIIFSLLTGMALINVLILAFGLPKVYEPDKNVSLKMMSIARIFLEILKIRDFRTYTISGALAFSGLFVYVTGAPAIFIDGYHVSKQEFGFIFALLAGGMIGGGQVNNFLLRRFTSEQLFKNSVICQLTVSSIFLVISIFGNLPMLPTIAFFFVLLVSAGIAFPNAAALALGPVTRHIGSASSLMGFLQMGLGAALAAMVGLLDIKGAFPTVVVMCLSAVLAGIVLWQGRRK